MDIDTIVLFGKDGREESFGLSLGPQERVAAEIKQIFRENPWAVRHEYYSDERQVDAAGVPLYEGDE